MSWDVISQEKSGVPMITSPLVIVKRAMQSIDYLHEVRFIVGGNIPEPEKIDNDWIECHLLAVGFVQRCDISPYQDRSLT